MTKYALVLIPLLLGIALAGWLRAGLAANPILYLRFDAGNIFLLLGIATSILVGLPFIWQDTFRYRARRALARWNTEQADSHRRFLRRLDHEVKNPLTAIRAGLANLDTLGDARVLGSIRAQVDRLARLTADLRKLADLETQSIDQEPVNLGQLLDELVTLEQERLETMQCKLLFTLAQAPWPLPPVAGDRDLLFIALHNLLDNAIKYSRPNGTIEIRAFEDGHWIAVQIADTGIGVTEEELVHLGEELYRGSSARGLEGSGLGLALARAIVARHGGTLTIRSRQGQGTVVTVRLPIGH